MLTFLSTIIMMVHLPCNQWYMKKMIPHMIKNIRTMETNLMVICSTNVKHNNTKICTCPPVQQSITIIVEEVVWIMYRVECIIIKIIPLHYHQLRAHTKYHKVQQENFRQCQRLNSASQRGIEVDQKSDLKRYTFHSIKRLKKTDSLSVRWSQPR